VFTGKSGKFTCDMLIYDEESDRHVRIKWADALKYAMMDMGGGDNTEMEGAPLGAAPGGGGPPAKLDFQAWKLLADDWTNFNAGIAAGNPIADEPAWVREYDRITAQPGARDVRIIVARPFIEHLMHSVVLSVAGRETGATLFGPADMQLSANTQVKTIEGHYTGHFKAVVTKPQNVLVMRDVACGGYVAGCNAKFFGTTSAAAADPREISESIQDRLSFSNEMDGAYESMLAFPAWAGQVEAGGIDTAMSVTSRLLPWDVQAGPGGGNTRKSFPGGPNMYAKYEPKLQLKQIHFGEDMKAVESAEFISQARCVPARFPSPLPFRRRTAPLPTPGADAGLDQQRHVLPRAAPPVRSVHQVVHDARAGPGPLWSRCDSGGAGVPLRPRAPHAPPAPHAPHAPRGRSFRTRAGAAASRSASRPRATPWWASSWRSTRRWSTRPSPRARPRAPRRGRKTATAPPKG